MNRNLSKTLNSQVIDGVPEPRPFCTLLCSMQCDGNSCECLASSLKAGNDALAGGNIAGARSSNFD